MSFCRIARLAFVLSVLAFGELSEAQREGLLCTYEWREAGGGGGGGGAWRDAPATAALQRTAGTIYADAARFMDVAVGLYQCDVPFTRDEMAAFGGGEAAARGERELRIGLRADTGNFAVLDINWMRVELPREPHRSLTLCSSVVYGLVKERIFFFC